MNSDFRVSVGFQHNKKIRRLRKLLGDSGPLSLVFLWGYAAQHCPDGAFTDMDDDEIEDVVSWSGEPGRLIPTLIDLCLVQRNDGVIVIHEWSQHNGYASAAKIRSEAAKAKAAKRWNAVACAAASENENAVACAEGHADDNAPNPSPNPSPLPTPKPSRAEYSAEFECFWETYPRKVDKSRAFKTWKARVKDGATPGGIIQAAVNYANECKRNGTEEQFIKHPATFLNPDWSQWVNREPRQEPLELAL